MKKFLNNRVFIIVLMICIMIVATGCGYKDAYGNTNYDDGFYRIKNTDMIYMEDTHIIYYKMDGTYAGYMAPYYNECGQLCRYVDGQIVPIE